MLKYRAYYQTLLKLPIVWFFGVKRSQYLREYLPVATDTKIHAKIGFLLGPVLGPMLKNQNTSLLFYGRFTAYRQ
jgi:hypothetical protein